ncbi:SpaA isopeptide-forming pilin-related protein [Streptomyces sp. NPDC053474]|uniref:SpaA isopeptide-forming pilin-related protein n=1 Tax=Streptomyces sp. NPDC053474 TaxID=3365704 RepID=UPI0037D38BCB
MAVGMAAPGGAPGRRRRAAALLLGLCVAGSPIASASALAPGAAARPAGPGDGTVTVRVVTEVDADGAYDSVLEPGMPGVKVTLTDDAGHVITATTGDDGTAVFTPASSELTGGKYRVDVSNPDPGTYSPAVAGLGGGADVIRSNTGFVTAGGGTDVTYTTGFWQPDLYCQENPTLVTCALSKGDATGRKGLVSFEGNISTTPPGGTVTDLTGNTEQQAVFGLGTDRTGNVYMGTMVKRHTAYGPAGPVNAIYRYNRTSDQVTTFATLPGTLTAHDTGNNLLNDDPVYSKVGREGIGDVDVSGDGRTMYAVNLNDSKLYTLPIQGSGDAVTAGTQTSYDIPKPADCVGEWHPYGLGVRGKRVLVGGVCGAEPTVTTAAPWGDPAQLSAHVYEFKGGAFTEAFTHKLDYPRGCAYRFTGAPATNYRCTDATTVGQRMSAQWEAWNERVPTSEEHQFVTAPQPILSNIEIADNGDLILGYRDRFADMQGNGTNAYGNGPIVNAVAAGDVLRACASGTTYTLESNGTCGSLTGSLPDNKLGPGGGEFYNDLTVLGDAQHDQVGEGGLVLQPYRKKLWSTVFDPFTNQAYEQGVRRWDSESGAITGNLTIQSTWAAPSDLFGKGNGLAELEIICDQAPVQIGNRVWFDADKDGVQDPSEPPIPGVKVTLTPKGGGDPITVVTDENGEYYVGTPQGLKPDTAYDTTFDYSGIDPSKLPGSPTLDELRWTTKEAGDDRLIDSNVDPEGRTEVTVGPPGYVNHGIDAGLHVPPRALLTVVKKDKATGAPLAGAVFEAWRETNGTEGLQTSGSDPDTKAGDACTTGADGRCVFRELPLGTYYLRETAVPDGYVLPRDPVSGPHVLTAGGDGKVVTLTNKPDLRLTLVKKDAKTGRPLAGAVFQLWRESNGKAGLQTSGAGRDTLQDAGCVTDRKGRCAFRELPPGTYYLRETAVPEGYVLPPKTVSGPYVLTVPGASEGDGLTVTRTNERGEPCKGKKC